MESASIQLLRELTQADAPSGHEAEARAIFERRLAGKGRIARDRIGNVTCTREGPAGSPRVLIECHLDEVGFIVQRVTSSGFVKFHPLGGWWGHTLPAQRVTILGRKGKVPGVIGSTPPHLLPASARDKVLDVADLFIDIGAESADQASEDFGVAAGCAIAPYGPFMEMKDPRLLSAKAFDNRAGTALAIETMERVGDTPNTLIAAGCVQEELGTRGARALAPSVAPDVAIVLEGPPADDTPGFNPEASQGELGGGVQIRLFDPTMIACPGLCDLVIDVARTKGIRHQIAVRTSGGTDAGAIHQTAPGIPSIVLGVPARYIHSHVSIINIEDYLAARDLVAALLARLDRATVDQLI